MWNPVDVLLFSALRIPRPYMLEEALICLAGPSRVHFAVSVRAFGASSLEAKSRVPGWCAVWYIAKGAREPGYFLRGKTLLVFTLGLTFDDVSRYDDNVKARINAIAH